MKIDLPSIYQAAVRSARHIRRSITGRDADGNSVREHKIDASTPGRLLTSPATTLHSIKEEFVSVLFFVGIIWAVFWIDFLLPFINFNKIVPLTPRTLRGLPGIFTMTFLHDNIWHLISNTLPLVVLLTLLAGTRTRAWLITLGIMIVTGALLWILGRNGTPELGITHVGASGLVMGLASFLIASALIERAIIPMVIAVLVGLIYGLQMVKGMIPTSNVSWDGHMCGALAGVIVAIAGAHAWFTKEVLGLRNRLVNREGP